jgi:hypothetical protein
MAIKRQTAHPFHREGRLEIMWSAILGRYGSDRPETPLATAAARLLSAARGLTASRCTAVTMATVLVTTVLVATVLVAMLTAARSRSSTARGLSSTSSFASRGSIASWLGSAGRFASRSSAARGLAAGRSATAIAMVAERLGARRSHRKQTNHQQGGQQSTEFHWNDSSKS